jgi:signal transduction histidine kinase
MRRILVVEDDPAMTEGIRDVLELAGYDVMTAADGREAIECMRRGAPDLILSDVMMPEMDGFTFYEEVRKNPAWTFVPFIFLTALGQRDSITHGKRLGADDYLIKPVDPDHLLATVEARLTRSEALSDAAASELQKFARLVTGVLGHELRTPLTWIRAYSEILLDLRTDMAQEELESALEGIKLGSDRLARLVEDAVILVSLDTGQASEDYRLAAEVEPNLEHRVRGVVEQMAPSAAAQGVQLEVEAEPNVPHVVLAPRFFTLIIRHLVENGVKFSRSEGGDTVTVRVRGVDAAAEVSVIDAGIGIPADQLERIFDPLVQVDRQQREQQGVGLGLAIVRGLVRCHGGDIWATSVEGAGTTVTLTIPAAGADGPGARGESARKRGFEPMAGN